MPIHDWRSEYSWLFHDLRAGWLSELSHEFNESRLPPGYYALRERWTGDGFERDTNRQLTGPHKPHTAITVRREQDDGLVAVCDLALPGYESGEVDVPATARRAAELLLRRIHLVVVDLYRPPRTHAKGIHGAIWDYLENAPHAQASDKPLTAVAYECGEAVIAHVEPVAVGDVLPDMPLFLVPGGHVLVPLEKTYLAAWEGVPRRWQKVIDPTSA